MRTRRVMHCAGPALLLALLVSWARADYAPRGRLNDLMLIYCGEDRWREKDFVPYVAYLGGRDRNTPQDWFYDSFLFCQYGDSPSGELYIDGETTRADWEHFHQVLFDPDSHLHALDRTIDRVAETLGRPECKAPIVVMIAYPHPGQTDFGDVDGDGVSEDLSKPEDRAKTVEWAVDSVIESFAAAEFAHLELVGFYWMIEWIPGGDDDSIVKRAAEIVHERELQFVWIPAYFADAAKRSAELGFDISYLQPNYAFMGQQGRRHDPQRLTNAAQTAWDHGLGIEIEMHPDLISDPERRRHLWDYLAHGAPDRDGYMRAAPHAYYQSYLTIKELHDSDDAELNALYDALYRFAKGTYRAPAPQPAARARAHRVLTDGRRLEVMSDEVERVSSARELDIELRTRRARFVRGVRVHYQMSAPDVEAPAWLSASAPEGGGDWAPVRANVSPQWAPSGEGEGFRAGAVALSFAPVKASRVWLTVYPQPGKSMSLDEVELLTTDPPEQVNLALYCPYRVSPDWPGTYPDDGRKLTDGERTTTSFAEGRTVGWYGGDPTVTIDLGRTVEVDEVAIGLEGGGAAAVYFPENATVLISKDGISWRPAGTGSIADADETANQTLLDTLRIGFAATSARYVRACFRTRAWLMVDEIDVRADGESVSRGRSYSVTPPPRSEAPYYDTTGWVLTDGVAGGTTYGKGRTIGWNEGTPTVDIDLGREVAARTLRAYVLGGGAAAVWFPEQVRAHTSLDGETWIPAGETVEHPAESGDENKGANMIVPLSSPPFRHLRVEFERNGWLMVGEIELHAE